MDYAMPRADDMPAFDVDSHEVPTQVNPLGAKGVGEAGTVGALPALMNAVNDALAPLGLRHIDMPVTAERGLRAIGGAPVHPEPKRGIVGAPRGESCTSASLWGGGARGPPR